MEADAPVDEVDALATRIEHIDELGAGDLCLWKKDGTLMTDGTLESNGVGRGHNLYAVLRVSSSTAVPAHTCPRSGTVPINHRGDNPGRITCGCEKTGEPDHYFTAEPLCRLCKADEQYWAYRVDGECQCVKTTGAGRTDCLEKGTCAPDPACAPTIDVDGTTSTSACSKPP